MKSSKQNGKRFLREKWKHIEPAIGLVYVSSLKANTNFSIVKRKKRCKIGSSF